MKGKVCAGCGRTIPDRDYWNVGSLRLRWFGDTRVHTHGYADIGPLCQACFDAVTEAIGQVIPDAKARAITIFPKEGGE